MVYNRGRVFSLVERYQTKYKTRESQDAQGQIWRYWLLASVSQAEKVWPQCPMDAPPLPRPKCGFAARTRVVDWWENKSFLEIFGCTERGLGQRALWDYTVVVLWNTSRRLKSELTACPRAPVVRLPAGLFWRHLRSDAPDRMLDKMLRIRCWSRKLYSSQIEYIAAKIRAKMSVRCQPG